MFGIFKALIKDNGDYENFSIDHEKLKIDKIFRGEFLNNFEILEEVSLKLISLTKKGISSKLKQAFAQK
jgi:hypothetical protein